MNDTTKDIETDVEPTPAAQAEDAAQSEEALNKAQQHYEEMLRARAELENLRRRGEREMEKARKFALERFMRDLLEVRDSLERGLEASGDDSASVASLREGQELTFRLLDQALKSNGLEVIDPEGQPFDPERHEAMSLLPTSEHEPDTVVSVVQKGFVLHERLLRPARVIVAKAP